MSRKFARVRRQLFLQRQSQVLGSNFLGDACAISSIRARVWK
jgi:hypothetical protein